MNQRELYARSLREEIRRKEEETLALKALLKTQTTGTGEGGYEPASPIPIANGHGRGQLSPSSLFQLSTSPSLFADQGGFGHANTSAVPRTTLSASLPVTAAATLSARFQHGDRASRFGKPMKRMKTTHMPDVPARSWGMTRSGSTVSTGSTPFTTSASTPISVSPSVPIHRRPLDRRTQPGSMSMLSHYLNQDPGRQPANAYVIGDSPEGGRPSRRHPAMGTLVESGKEMDPVEYLSMIGTDNASESPHVSGPINIPGSHLRPARASGSCPQPGMLSDCGGSMTSAPTLETIAMSRQSSQALTDSAMISAGLGMVRIQSQTSARGHSLNDTFGRYNAPMSLAILGKRPASDEEPDLEGVGADFPESFVYPAPIAALQDMAMARSVSQTTSVSASPLEAFDDIATPHRSQAMDRSESSRSNQSRQLRAKEALYRHNQNAARSLQPKPAVQVPEHRVFGSVSPTDQEGKAQIARHKYKRPSPPKQTCCYCSHNPKGFRGEHELRRHIDAKHKTMVKKYICIEPEGETSLKPIKPLADCKQCVAKKRYGADYNAAAHLRRTHFKEKPSRKNVGKCSSLPGSNGGATADERRGGKGGGNWPPMPDLKHWMRLIIEPIDDPWKEAAERDDLEAEEGSPDDINAPPAVPGPLLGSSTGAYLDTSPIAGIGSGIDLDDDISMDDDSATTLMLYPFAEHDNEGRMTEMYQQQVGPPMSAAGLGVPYTAIPSSTFNLDGPMSPSTMTHDAADPLASIDYLSALSSPATVTQASYPEDHQHTPSTAAAAQDNLLDLGFDLVFPPSQ